ncbi:Mitochondrial uncoupling protein 5 [Asimina triloba]
MSAKGFVEGGIASIVAGCSTHPLDLIKVRLQLHGETPALATTTATLAPPRVGPISIGVRIARYEGLRALFSGVSATVLRQTLYSTTRMGLYEILKSNWSDADSGTIPLPRKITAGLIVGAVGATVGNPANVAMVRMQANGLLPESQRWNYHSVGDAIGWMWRQEGVASLWRGSSLTVNRAMIVTASQLAMYDQVKETMLKKKMMHVPGQLAAANLGGRGDSLMCMRADD